MRSSAFFRLRRRALLFLILCSYSVGCARDLPKEAASEVSSSSQAPESSQEQQKAFFEEMAAETGLSFTHRNGATGELHIGEVMGPGVGLLDYDRDGDLDVILRRGGSLTGTNGGAALFRNDLSAGEDGGDGQDLRFVDVSDDAGFDGQGYGMGVAVGDIDGDQLPDLYFTNFGPNQLWRNRGDGTFEDLTVAGGVGDSAWSVGASFFDYDRDGDLDLFVANYVDFNLQNAHPCYHPSSAQDFCGPDSYGDVSDRLYQNQGDGTFEDVTAVSGLASAFGSGLGTLAFDADGDGWLDLYVANDADENLLWRNQGDGSFSQQAVLSGCATNGRGEKEASMGIAFGDVDADGDGDLFLTHLDGESNTLYKSGPGGIFTDATAVAGLAAPSLSLTCFGTAFLDADLDGHLDLYSACGAVKLFREGGQSPSGLAQENQFYQGLGNGRFRLLDSAATTRRVAATARRGGVTEVSRGLAVGDLDNDGDPDIIVTNNDSAASLLLNRGGPSHSWIGVLGLQEPGGLPVMGAQVTARSHEGGSQWRQIQRDGSYASSNDPRALFGLGDEKPLAAIRIVWPDGVVEEWPELKTNQYHSLLRGTGLEREQG